MQFLKCTYSGILPFSRDKSLCGGYLNFSLFFQNRGVAPGLFSQCSGPAPGQKGCRIGLFRYRNRPERPRFLSRALRVVYARGTMGVIEPEERSHVHDHVDDAPAARGAGLDPVAAPSDDRGGIRERWSPRAPRARNRFHLINGYLVEKMTQNPPHAIADQRCGSELVGSSRRAGTCVPPSRPAPRPRQRARARSLRRARTIDDYGAASRAGRHGPGRRGRRLQPGGRPRLRHQPLWARGHPGLLDRQRERPPGRGLHRPRPRGYAFTETFAEGQSVPVVIDGREVGRIAVTDLLPPHRPGAKAEGNGA